MAQLDSAPFLPPSRSKMVPSAAQRLAVIAAMALLLGFIVYQGRSLWQEWVSLNGEKQGVRDSNVIGYRNIQPNYSYAKKPADWLRHDGEFTLLWSGWDPTAGHCWFRIPRDELIAQGLSHPLGRDVIQAIDFPLTEQAGGAIWKRIPSDAMIAPVELNGVITAYPIQVLDKVFAVNDQLGARSVLVIFDPMDLKKQVVHVFEPMVEGRRVILGVSGYFRNNKPIFFDRRTESLWAETEDGSITAIAGPSKGAAMHEISRLASVSWSSWSSKNPEGRLLVGADRSKKVSID